MDNKTIAKESLDLSPFTGNKDVLIENDQTNGESRLCLVSGYNTRELYKIDNPDVKKFESTSTELIRSLRYEDKKLGQYWYLTTVVTDKGMIYPDHHEVDGYEWIFAPLITIDESEKEKYPIPDKPGEFYAQRLAIEVQRKFHKDSFMAACRELGALRAQ
tara:strand:+ start:35 stop:514 length:480 start_codon:yes stop_codon:yes gene_type:complete